MAHCGHLAGGRLSYHRLIGRRQVRRVQRPRAVDGHPVNGTEGRMGEVQVQASVRGAREQSVSQTHTIIITTTTSMKGDFICEMTLSGNGGGGRASGPRKKQAHSK